MKTVLALSLLAAAIALSACGQSPIVIDAPKGALRAPHSGISVANFTAAWAEIAPQLPDGHTLLDLTIQAPTKIQVNTCKPGSHSQGTGGSFVFEKIKGKWTITETGSWVS